MNINQSYTYNIYVIYSIPKLVICNYGGWVSSISCIICLLEVMGRVLFPDLTLARILLDNTILPFDIVVENSENIVVNLLVVKEGLVDVISSIFFNEVILLFNEVLIVAKADDNEDKVLVSSLVQD